MGALYVDDPTGPDGYGSDTHTASVVGGRIFGVAKQVNLLNVQIWGQSGSNSLDKVLSAIQWTTNHSRGKKGVAHLEINTAGGRVFLPISSHNPLRRTSLAVLQALNDAVSAAVLGGLPMVMMSGNKGTVRIVIETSTIVIDTSFFYCCRIHASSHPRLLMVRSQSMPLISVMHDGRAVTMVRVPTLRPPASASVVRGTPTTKLSAY